MILIGTFVLGGALCVPPPNVVPEPVSTRAQYIETYCTTLERCEDTVGQLYIDGQACRSYLEDYLRCGLEIQTGKLRQSVAVAYSEVHGKACIAWLAGLSCDAEDMDSDDCKRAIQPVDAVGVGESCESTTTTFAGCGADLYCERQTDDQTCDVCRRQATAGEACNDGSPRIPCADELFCNPQSQLCSPTLDDNASCTSDASCASGWCRSQLCTPKLERGVGCTSSDRCAQALRCDGATCTDRVAPGLACAGDQDCLQPAICLSGTCARVGVCERPTAGNACLYSCADGAFCESNQCKAFVAPGEPCTSHVQCGFPEAICQTSTGRCLALASLGDTCGATRPCQPFSATCDNLTDPQNPLCVTARADGSACSDDNECLSFYCDLASDTCGDRALMCSVP